MSSITFFYPNKIIKGTELLFIRLFKYLAPRKIEVEESLKAKEISADLKIIFTSTIINNGHISITFGSLFLYFFYSKNFKLSDELYLKDYNLRNKFKKIFPQIINCIYLWGKKKKIDKLCYKIFAKDFTIENIGIKILKLFAKTSFNFDKYKSLKIAEEFKLRDINSIVFLADLPQFEEAEGMMQRIVAIDNIFKNQSRLYISTPKKGRIKKSRVIIAWLLLQFYKPLDFKNKLCIKVTTDNKEKLLNYSFNKRSIIDICKVIQLLSKANKIYVHSLYNGLVFIDILMLLKKKIILDIHGLVPEEKLFMGDSKKSVRVINKIEEKIFKISDILVSVSNKMKNFYIKKYPFLTDKQFIALPIFDAHLPPAEIRDINNLYFIYAGGLQKWQNIDKIVAAIKIMPDDFSYIFLVPNYDLKEMKIKIESLNINMQKIEIQSVSKNKIYDYYQKSTFGFIIREEIDINQASCPTKLIEYLSNGVIPVVLQPEIGDFNDLGYKYILLEDLKNGKKFNQESINEMRKANYQLCEKLKITIKNNIKNLRNL
jgi:hypothetical protein